MFKISRHGCDRKLRDERSRRLGSHGVQAFVPDVEEASYRSGCFNLSQYIFPGILWQNSGLRYMHSYNVMVLHCHLFLQQYLQKDGSILKSRELGSDPLTSQRKPGHRGEPPSFTYRSTDIFSIIVASVLDAPNILRTTSGGLTSDLTHAMVLWDSSHRIISKFRAGEPSSIVYYVGCRNRSC